MFQRKDNRPLASVSQIGTAALFISVLFSQAPITDQFTSVSQLGLTVTNFGILGNGWNKQDNKILPSCQYKQHTEILREQVEHFSYAGLWIGGKVDGEKRVSTAIVDGVFESGQEGFELFETSEIEIRSSIASTADDSMARYYSPFAVSHQDFLTDFRDYGVNTSDDNGIINHNPLGIDIHLESYAWNYTFADAFVILNYTITNASTATIEDLYAGLWMDASVANMNYTNKYEPGGGFTWYDNLDGFDKTSDDAGYKRDIGYQYDKDGDDGWAQSYIGVSMLGSTTPRPYIGTHYNQWVWTNSNNSDYPNFSMPITDEERYEKMSSSVELGPGPPNYTDEGYPAVANSWLYLLSAGPFGSSPANADSSSWSLAPGESCNVAFALVCGLWEGNGCGENSDEDCSVRRKNLHINHDWAQKAYDGEDINRNNILDEGEDLNDDGIIDRYVLPAPPPVPNMAIVVEDREVTVYWQNNAEDFVDPISREQDFEGYKIWGARKTMDSNEEFSLLGEFDKDDSTSASIGYNTGFEAVRIMDAEGNQDSVEVSGRYYHYKFVNTGVQNGWLNYYAVTAYDRGDPDSNLESLESSVYSNRKYVYPGVSAAVDSWTNNPSVYPNPFKGQAQWDGYGSRAQMLWFQGLPQKAEIRIFTLSGDLVDIINHSDDYSGSDIQNINDQRSPQFAGGEHAWDLITRHDQAVASGLYLFTVKNLVDGSSSFGET
ncbi:MAG: hypothetical protein QGH89_06290, partial [Candidatus Marinimicrobia bacterium]|nr:hypothetical protein [Candidatus Neomarinimicrobiota bacterium]